MPEAVDVIVIGAGPTGAVMARRLAAAGIDVLCLERGEWPEGPDVDWEVAGRGPLHFSPNRRRGSGDYLVDDSASDMEVLIGTGVGGGTVLWGAQWERLLPSDFRVRTLDGVADDWPIGYDDLAPYYDRADEEFGLAAAHGDPAFPESGRRPPHPPLPLLALGERVARAHNDLGWHWWPGPNVVGTPEEYEAARRTGYPPGLRARADSTHWPAALAAGARLETGATALAVSCSRRDRADAIVWRDRDGVVRTTRCEQVVLAAGGIGTPRLLLASGEDERGLGNSSGLVGRRLMLHPFTRVVGLFEEPFDEVQGYWGQLLHCLEFAESDPRRGFLRGSKWNLGQGFGAVAAALHPWPDGKDAGEALPDHVRRWVDRAGIWGITVDDLPEEENRVRLRRDRVDRDGLPVVAVEYTTPPDAQRALAFARERAVESLRAAGAVEVLTAPVLRPFGWHQLGTARMGRDPRTSVVDDVGRMHDVPNVRIVDGSVFVTGSSLNPTATAVAIAMRAADDLVASAS